jgi:uncharacterized protein
MPFLGLQCFSSLYGQKFLESALHEWIAQSHLLRTYKEIYYFRNGFEIDCIAGTHNFEIKTGKPHRNYPKFVKVIDNFPEWLATM